MGERCRAAQHRREDLWANALQILACKLKLDVLHGHIRA